MAFASPSTGELQYVLDGYDLDYDNMGIVIIINNIAFDDTRLQRQGAIEDSDRLKQIFLKLGYKKEDIHSRQSVTVDEFRQFSKEIKENLVKKEHSTFVFCFMTHGLNNSKVRMYNEEIDFWADVMKEFCDVGCPKLVGKPKVVITQFCQGTRMLKGVPLGKRSSDDDCTLPEFSDVIILQAAPPMYAALRHEQKGSLFIQTLCDIIEEHPTMSITQVMTHVTNRLAKMECDTATEPSTKSLPVFWSSLRKMFYFKRPEPE